MQQFLRKGGLISERFSLWLKSPKKGAKNYSEHCIWIEDAQDTLSPSYDLCDFAKFPFALLTRVQ